MPNKREVIQMVLEGRRPPYVPWSFKFTLEAGKKLQEHYGCDPEDASRPLNKRVVRDALKRKFGAHFQDDYLRLQLARIGLSVRQAKFVHRTAMELESERIARLLKEAERSKKATA